MKPPTRLRILDHIRRYHSVSVNELSRVLGMTGANIRHHLVILESNDLIEVVGRQKEERGRPFNIYGLSRRMLGDGLDELSSGLLDVWLVGMDDRTQEASLTAVAQRLAGESNKLMDTPIPLRLTKAINRLNELHYEARWEASAAGPRLILGHCPYAAIISNHPELCQMDAYLLEAQIKLHVERIEKLQPSVNGLPFCAFLVKGK